MALIKCIECEKEFSEYAKECPNCGCPTKIIHEKMENHKKEEKIQIAEELKDVSSEKSKKRKPIFESIVILIIIIASLFFFINNENKKDEEAKILIDTYRDVFELDDICNNYFNGFFASFGTYNAYVSNTKEAYANTSEELKKLYREQTNLSIELNRTFNIELELISNFASEKAILNDMLNIVETKCVWTHGVNPENYDFYPNNISWIEDNDKYFTPSITELEDLELRFLETMNKYR